MTAGAIMPLCSTLGFDDMMELIMTADVIMP